MPDLHDLSAADLAAGIAAGRFTSVAATEACLARIEAREPTVGAWTFLDPALALAQARERDAAEPSGPLHGVPVGLKDIIDTADMPTAYGSPVYAGHRPLADAAPAALLRQAGAVILGKTVTTEFATFTPGKTANPHNPAHTPGGSSSGSAAAVADRMVPLALGSQTAGSVIRPAAFCGVVGYKATHGVLPITGMKPLAPSLDTLGCFTRHVADIALLRAALVGAPLTIAPVTANPRLGLCRTPQWSHADADGRAALEAAAKRLADAGAAVEEVELPTPFAHLVEAQMTVMEFEGRRAFAWELAARRDQLSERFVQVVGGDKAIPFAAYQEARRAARDAIGLLDLVFARFDALLVPSAAGEAPAGLGATGDPIFNRMWTLLGVPALTLPVATGGRGLPVGVQLIGPRHADEELLSAAAWAEERLS